MQTVPFVTRVSQDFTATRNRTFVLQWPSLQYFKQTWFRASF